MMSTTTKRRRKSARSAAIALTAMVAGLSVARAALRPAGRWCRAIAASMPKRSGPTSSDGRRLPRGGAPGSPGDRTCSPPSASRAAARRLSSTSSRTRSSTGSPSRATSKVERAILEGEVQTKARGAVQPGDGRRRRRSASSTSTAAPAAASPQVTPRVVDLPERPHRRGLHDQRGRQDRRQGDQLRRQQRDLVGPPARPDDDDGDRTS